MHLPAFLASSEYGYVLKKRRAAAGFGFLVVFLAALVVTIFERPQYRASVTLAIERAEPVFSTGPQLAVLDETFLQTQRKVFVGSELAARLAKGLLESGQFDAPRLLDAFGVQAERGREAEALAAGVRRSVSVVVVPRTRVFEVSVSAGDPDVAVAAANGLVDAFVERLAQTRELAAGARYEHLLRQMEDFRSKLTQAQEKLLEFTREAGVVFLEGTRTTDAAELETLSRRYTEARLRCVETEAELTQLREMRERGALTASMVEELDPQVAELQKRLAALELELELLLQEYKDKHPEVVAKRGEIEVIKRELEERVDRAIEALEARLEAQRGERDALAAVLAEAKEGYLETSRAEAEREMLESEVATNKEIFQTVMQKVRELDLAGGTDGATVEVIERAQSAKLVRPRPRLNIGLGFLVGCFAGVGLAFLQEYLDRSIKSVADLRRAVDAPLLGTIPYVEEDGPLLLGQGGMASATGPLAEAFRTLRTNIRFSGEGIRRILVTSAAEGEGKSTISMNLAAVLADAGARVILVEADLRRPGTSRTLDLPREKGLSNVLVGERSLGECIVHTPVKGLDVLPSGPLPPNPAEMLGGEAAGKVIGELSAQYDYVVLDSPPVVAVTDAQILATHSDGVLVVVRAGATQVEPLRHAFELLAKVNANVLGVVMSGLERRGSNYYYHYHYRT